jgi:hypothetical protein
MCELSGRLIFNSQNAFVEQFLLGICRKGILGPAWAVICSDVHLVLCVVITGERN